MRLGIISCAYTRMAEKADEMMSPISTDSTT